MMNGIDPATEFKQEAYELLAKFEETLLNLEVSPHASELVESACRTLHSLKGAGMMFGWEALAAFIHQVETILAEIHYGALVINSELVTLTLGVADHIRGLLEQTLDPARGTTLLTALADLVKKLPRTSRVHPLMPLTSEQVTPSSAFPTTCVLDEWPTLPSIISGPVNSNNTIRVSVTQITQLMEQAMELVVIQEQLARIASNQHDASMSAVAADIKRVVTSLYDTALTFRMLPIGTLFRRFRRVVRDLAHELGKTVELFCSGETTTIDKLLVEGLYDPLLHLIRNSIDHGIESPPQRLARGKTSGGRLYLDALRSEEKVVITITDDGQGLDYEAIRTKAETIGLCQPGQEVSRDELVNYIFHAGFSTATQITQISGRGFGMDVVKRAIDNLRGTIELKSELGCGVTIILKLPLTGY